MRDGTLELESLVAPTDPRTFFQDYWERQPLYVPRNQSGFYDAVLSLADVDRLLTGSDLRFPAVRLVSSGAKSAPAQFTTDVPWGKDVFTGVLDVDRALSAYYAGSTIVIEALHRSWPPLAAFCRRLEAALSHPVQANVYLTPKAAQGFAPHYDTHDVFVLQVFGVKHWRIYHSPVRLPDRSQPYRAADHPIGAPSLAVDLHPGDLLYLPRGYIHEGLTSDQDSLHVTVGITSYTWIDVFADLLARARKQERFRESLPIQFDRLDGGTVALETRFAELRDELTTVADLGDILDSLVNRFHSSRRPILDGHLLALVDVDRLDLACRLALREGVLWRTTCAADTLTLRFHAKSVTLPRYAEPALAFVLRGGPFTVADIPGLDDAGKVVLARRLVREGLLRPVAT